MTDSTNDMPGSETHREGVDWLWCTECGQPKLAWDGYECIECGNETFQIRPILISRAESNEDEERGLLASLRRMFT